MKKEWFVLQTLTGQENKVQTSIKARTALEQMGEYIGQCIIPMEKVTETKNGKKRTLNKKVFRATCSSRWPSTERVRIRRRASARSWSARGSSCARRPV